MPKLIQEYVPLQQKQYLLNDEEERVISFLRERPLLKMKELMAQTGYGYQRIKKILVSLHGKDILRFSVDPDYTRLGLEFHNALVKIHPAHSKAFEKSIFHHPQVHWMKKGLGRWDYILSITARNITEFINITQEIREQNRTLILEFTALISKVNVMRKY